MIKLGMYPNKEVVEPMETFPDGTPLLKSYVVNRSLFTTEGLVIYWKYEDDAELFRLLCIVRDLQEKGESNITLIMPYIPNARMDRVHGIDDVFTLKYFAEVINSLKFKKVVVLDAHSDVSLALIDRCVNINSGVVINTIIKDQLKLDETKDFVVYPDAGCKKRLEDHVKFPSVFCNKSRDWSTGKILGTEVFGDLEKLKGARVLFVDDICAYGGTAKFTLEKLFELGVSECYCYFTHVEDSIFGKEDWKKTGVGLPTLLNSGLVDGIYFTDSLLSDKYLSDEKLLESYNMHVLDAMSFVEKFVKE